MNEVVAMQAFLSVVEVQSFSAAARLLGVSQSSVSRRVADLEDQLQVALLVRTTREVRPTEAGLRYYHAARDAVAAVEAARAVAQEGSIALSGTLRIGCGGLFADTWLAPRLHLWLERHPGLRLEFELTNTYVDLVTSGLDLALRFGGPATPELLGRRLKTFSRHLMASPQWVQRQGHPSTPSDLRDVRCLMLGGPDTRQIELHRGDERASVRPDQTLVASAGAFLETLARHHVGPILAPEWIGEPRRASGELVRLLPEWEGSAMTLWVVWPNHSFQSAATRSFLDWMIEQMG
ncbi:MAG: LysR family transcriptional regulator [Myxococcota bacterium]